MRKSLNLSVINQRISDLGLSQAKISQSLDVSREAVSQWFNNQSFPRPDKLLKLGQLFNLKFNELVLVQVELEPVIAFRKAGNAKTTEKHYKRAKEMGFALEKLVSYLPFETITRAPELISPKNDYAYIQSAAKAVREKLGLAKITVEAAEIIKYYKQSKTIIIPLLLGEKKYHENALHIHLPASATNWVYINLDTNELDFKFWLVHELGHVFTPSLRNDKSELFADNFAGAFLFPKEVSKIAYEDTLKMNDNKKKIQFILGYAKRYVISANTVYKEINKYAESIGQKKLELGQEFYQFNTKFEKSYKLVSENIFGKNRPEAAEFISVAEKEFDTIFFNLLRQVKQKENCSSSYIKSVLNLSITDSIEIYNSL